MIKLKLRKCDKKTFILLLLKINIYSFISVSNVYYGDANDAYDFQNARSYSECCDICSQEYQNCAAFSYLSNNKLCYIYSNPLPPKQTRFNTTSGTLDPNYPGYIPTTTNSAPTTTKPPQKCNRQPNIYYGDATDAFDFKDAKT